MFWPNRERANLHSATVVRSKPLAQSWRTTWEHDAAGPGMIRDAE